MLDPASSGTGGDDDVVSSDDVGALDLDDLGDLGEALGALSSDDEEGALDGEGDDLGEPAGLEAAMSGMSISSET